MEISEDARIVTLCDVYAAITETRPYATSMPGREAPKRMGEKQARLDMTLLRHFANMTNLLQQAGQEHYTLALRVGRKPWKEMTWRRRSP